MERRYYQRRETSLLQRPDECRILRSVASLHESCCFKTGHQYEALVT